MIKISVVIPVYNMERYLEQCLDSVCKQTLEDIEILCINDGSMDGSLEILKLYRAKDTRIQIIDQQNQGVAKTRNIGIKLAQGKYVIFLDPDDWYPANDILESLYLAAEENGVSIAGGSFMDYHDGIYNEKFEERYYGYHFEKDGVIEYEDYQFDFGYQRFIFEKKLLVENNIYFKEYIRYQDPPFMVEAMICAGKFYGMNKPSYCYRYGHEIISWNREKVCAVLKGIRDNLDISKKHGLKKLHQLCVIRLNEEYRQLLGDSIFFEDYAIDVSEAICETLFHIDEELLEGDEYALAKICSPIVARIKEDITNHQNYIRELEERCVREEKDKENLKQEIVHLKIALQYLDNDRKWLENDNHAVYESFSYRFGHKATAVPRWIYRKLRGN